MAPISETIPWDLGHSKVPGDLAGHVAGLKDSAADSRVGGLTEDSTAEGKDEGVPEFSAEEVSLHNQRSDCWLIINEEVYDVTSWVPKHPGGAMIYARAGQDCTELFNSYHPLYVRKMLGKYKIGRMAATGSADSVSSTLHFSPDTGFYQTLKQRVELYFKQQKINPGHHPLVVLQTAVIFLGILASFYGAFLAPLKLKHAVACAVSMSFFMTLGAACIAHETYHGLLKNWAWVPDFILGISSFMYTQQHALGHHVNTNVFGFDADIRVTEKDVRRVAPQQPRHWYHQYQAAYMLVFYGLFPFKAVFVDDFRDYMNGFIGRSPFPKMTLTEEVVFWGGKIFYMAYTFVLPVVVGNRTVSEMILLKSISLVLIGIMYNIFYQVGHLNPKTQFPVAKKMRDDGKMEVALPWAEFQVVTTCNFSPGSRLWNHITGGTNHGIEHHLFPGVCHAYYPDIQPIVESTCKEFDIPYNFYPSLYEAVMEHWQHMNNLGAEGVDCHID